MRAASLHEPLELRVALTPGQRLRLLAWNGLLARRPVPHDDVAFGSEDFFSWWAVLGPGSEIVARETTTACQVMPPFSRWEKGRRLRAQSEQGTVSADA